MNDIHRSSYRGAAQIFPRNLELTRIQQSVCKAEGMLSMNWTYGYDSEKQYMDEAALATIMLDADLLSNGGSQLMHDREGKAIALEGILKGLRTKGYELMDPSTIQVSKK